MKKLAAILVFALPLQAAELRTSMACPVCPLETCRWEISVQRHSSPNRVEIHWNKSVETRHTEKPKAAPIHCNVDRDFNFEGGGYLRVWFENESEPCEASTNSDPTLCGVSFITDPASQTPFPIGFRVQAPKEKSLAKVEHLSTLNLQCGSFHPESKMEKAKWDVKVGWDKTLPGDGTYVLPVK
jgi:hypothetical protein